MPWIFITSSPFNSDISALESRNRVWKDGLDRQRACLHPLPTRRTNMFAITAITGRVGGALAETLLPTGRASAP
jgi:hypothetical protein